MMCRRVAALLSVPFTVLLLLSVLQAETLNLSRKFVNDHMNRATIKATFELDSHLKKAHTIASGGDDGDVHMAGRAPEVQLPMVAEIMNAGLPAQKASLDLMNKTPAGKNVSISGAWRIWFEHPATGEQTQGDTVDKPSSTETNPAHVFEIHPVIVFGGNDITASSLVEIENSTGTKTYSAYSASKAFPYYDSLKATVSASSTSVSITAKKAVLNYTEFELEPVGKVVPGDGNDGLFVLANVYDVSDDEAPVTDEPRRMVFVDGSVPAKVLQKLPSGERMHVLGIPRVNLAEVAAAAGDEETDISLPYEIIVVAVYPDSDTPTAPHAKSTAKSGSKGSRSKKTPKK